MCTSQNAVPPKSHTVKKYPQKVFIILEVEKFGVGCKLSWSVQIVNMKWILWKFVGDQLSSLKPIKTFYTICNNCICLSRSSKIIFFLKFVIPLGWFLLFIRPFFNTSKLRQLLTANYFSILYYNAEIWHVPSLNAYLKQKLFAASAEGL